MDGGKCFEIRSSINLPWDHARSHKKIEPDRFGSFEVYRIQTDNQSKYIDS